jgi:hypothetical protein
MFDPISAAEASAAYSVSLLLDPQRLNRLSWQQSLNNDIPTVSGIVNQLFNATWKADSEQHTQLNQRVKMVVIDSLMDTLANPNLSPENRLVLEGNLFVFTKWLKRNDDSLADQALLNHLNVFWQTGDWRGGFEAVKLPPGSPI